MYLKHNNIAVSISKVSTWIRNQKKEKRFVSSDALFDRDGLNTRYSESTVNRRIELLAGPLNCDLWTKLGTNFSISNLDENPPVEIDEERLLEMIRIITRKHKNTLYAIRDNTAQDASKLRIEHDENEYIINAFNSMYKNIFRIQCDINDKDKRVNYAAYHEKTNTSIYYDESEAPRSCTTNKTSFEEYISRFKVAFGSKEKVQNDELEYGNAKNSQLPQGTAFEAEPAEISTLDSNSDNDSVGTHDAEDICFLTSDKYKPLATFAFDRTGISGHEVNDKTKLDGLLKDKSIDYYSIFEKFRTINSEKGTLSHLSEFEKAFDNLRERSNLYYKGNDEDYKPNFSSSTLGPRKSPSLSEDGSLQDNRLIGPSSTKRSLSQDDPVIGPSGTKRSLSQDDSVTGSSGTKRQKNEVVEINKEATENARLPAVTESSSPIDFTIQKQEQEMPSIFDADGGD